MNIQDKSVHDPVADLYMVDAYLRWALMAAEEVVGPKGMPIVLRQANLYHLSNDYPPDDMEISKNYTAKDYANLSAALLNFFGRAGKSMTIRIGRRSAEHAVNQRNQVLGISTLVKASRLLPLARQQQAGLAVMQNALIKSYKSVGQDLRMHIEDRGDKLAYVSYTCLLCAGKKADEHICWVQNGVLLQGMHWLTGKEFDIQEVECRALGDPACVWEISKTPKA